MKFHAVVLFAAVAAGPAAAAGGLKGSEGARRLQHEKKSKSKGPKLEKTKGPTKIMHPSKINSKSIELDEGRLYRCPTCNSLSKAGSVCRASCIEKTEFQYETPLDEMSWCIGGCLYDAWQDQLPTESPTPAAKSPSPTNRPTKKGKSPTGKVPGKGPTTKVPGRPFVGSDGRGLLAPQCSGTQCEDRVASLSEGTTMRTPLVGNATSDDDLGGEWTRNALGEHASVASFAAFSIALMSNRAPSHLVEDALNAALDELRHAEVSFDIASRLVGAPLGPGPLPPSRHEFRGDLGALAAAVAREGCVDETLSALALAAECELVDGALERGAAGVAKYRGVPDEVLIWIRDELRTIAADEAGHSALAWRTLGWVCSVDAEACEAAKQSALTESSLVAAFQLRFGRDFEGHPELLERMRTAWSRIYTNSQLLGFEGVESECVAGDLNEVRDQDFGSQSLLSLLVDNILRGSHV